MCDDGQNVKTSVCPSCRGYSQSAHDKIPSVCEECVDHFHGSSPAFLERLRFPLAHRRAVMYSRCAHPACVRDKRRTVVECSCGRGSELAARQREAVEEFVQEVRNENGLAFAECRVVVVVVGVDGVAANAVASRAARAIREAAAAMTDTAVRVVRIPKGNEETVETATRSANLVVRATRETPTANVSDHSPISMSVVESGVGSTVVRLVVEGDEDEDENTPAARCGSIETLAKALRAAAPSRSSSPSFFCNGGVVGDDDDDEDENDGDLADDVYGLRQRESRGARSASRPYESRHPERGVARRVVHVDDPRRKILGGQETREVRARRLLAGRDVARGSRRD